MYVRWNVQKVLNVMHCNVARNVGAAKQAHQLWRREQLYMLLDHCKKLTNMCHFRITLSISWSQVSLIHLYVMHNTKKKGSVHLGNCSNTIFGRNSGQGPPMFFYTRDVSLARARCFQRFFPPCAIVWFSESFTFLYFFPGTIFLCLSFE